MSERRFGVALIALAMAPATLAQEIVFEDGFEQRCLASAGGGTAVANPQLIATLSNSFHEAWLGSPAVVDLNGDGTQEILVPRHDRLLGWHLPNNVVFQQLVPSRIWASPVVGDFVSTSPGLEVAVAAADGIYLWNAAGTLQPGFPAIWRSELRSLAGGDIDGDGTPELVVVSTSRLVASGQSDILFAVRGNGTTVAGFPPNTTGAAGCTTTCFVVGGYDQNIALGNVDADPALEVFAGQDNAYLSLHQGNGFAFDANPIFQNRDKFSGIRSMLDYALAQQGFADDEAVDLQGHFTNSAPVFADVDGNGLRELVVLGSVQNAAQTDRLRGVALYAFRTDGTRPANWTAPFHAPTYLAGLYDFAGTNVVAATNAVAVADIDPMRPGSEFVFAGFDGRIHAVDSAAQEVWQYTYTTDPRVLTGGVVLGDLSRDARPEVVFATYSPDTGKSALIILGPTGQLLRSVSLPDRGAMPVPTLADVDGNQTVDIVVSLKDGVTGAGARQVQVYEVANSLSNCLAWPTGRGNLLRNGNPP